MYSFKFDKKEKIATGALILGLCLALGFYFSKLKVFQTHSKAVAIYKQALKDFENGNYSNSYYLFSKIGYMSDLKPVALYRQALCAKALGDKKSELSTYKLLFKNYPKSKFSAEGKYQAGQLLIDDNPNLAKKYFKSVLKSSLDKDYKVAADYYIARIQATKIRYSRNKKVSSKKMSEIETSFRTYLEEYPDGKHAINVADTWKKFNPDITSKDAVLAARAYYYADMFQEADEILKNISTEDSWAVNGANNYPLRNYAKANTLIEQGVEKFDQNVNRKDYNNAIDKYIEFSNLDKVSAAARLLAFAKGEKRDYILNKKCEYISQNSKLECYQELYKTFPNGEYTQNALLEIFLAGIRNRNYSKCAKIAEEFLTKYPNSKHVPLFMFWAGKIMQITGKPGYTEYFQKVITQYPDSYYAYRAFWILRGLKSATLKTDLEYKPVEYPYKTPQKNELSYSLIEVQDYDMLTKVVNDDFIKSWIEYEKGNYAASLVIARDAMDKMTIKPVKSDLRWRLVYPLTYYKQVKHYADLYKNNDALIMAIIRAESSFNTDAQSNIGAMGLMQLMPSTAHEIGKKHEIVFNTASLFNTDLNLILGNMYYAALKETLNNKEVSAIAAYNGGIGSVQNWKATLSYIDTDDFINKIPYPETKDYVEKVFKGYWNYVRIYQKQ